MPIATTCPHCGTHYNLADAHAGKKAKCKNCKQIFQIPGPAGPADGSAPAAGGTAPRRAPAAAPPPMPTATESDDYDFADAPAPARESHHKSEEMSEGGIPIIRHPTDRGRAPSPHRDTPAVTPYMEQIEAHVAATIGPFNEVFHEIVSDEIHLDLIIVPPTNQEPSEEHPLGTYHFTVITCGLSAHAQAVPEDAQADGISPLQELMVCLPGDWPGMRPDGKFDKNITGQDENWWPFAFLKMVARMPAEYQTFLAPGVTIPNGEAAEPFADNTKLGCMMAFAPILSPNSAELDLGDGQKISFYSLWPLYPEEMNLKLKKGLHALLEKLQESETSELITLDRKNLAARKGWFGLGR